MGIVRVLYITITMGMIREGRYSLYYGKRQRGLKFIVFGMARGVESNVVDSLLFGLVGKYIFRDN
jgi:hypothetical protein